MKRTLMLLTAVVVMLGMAYAHDAAAEEQPIARATVSVHSGLLNGRSRPTKDSSIEARFSDGDVLTIYEAQGEWARTDGGEAGYCWVHINYLMTEERGIYTVVADGRLRLRNTPDGETVDWLKAGQAIEVLGVFGNWARTENGWVMIANGDEPYLERDED